MDSIGAAFTIPVPQTTMAKEVTFSGSRYRGLQVLRVLAACLVVWSHCTFYTSERLGHGQRVWSRGAIGVDLFFVLSGFVMIVSSERLFKDADGWKIFAKRRIVRIVPMYWLITTVKLVIMIVAGGLVLHASLSLPKLFYSYFFLPSYNVDGWLRPLLNVGWTLNFEMFFYFLFTLGLLLRVNIYRLVGAVLTLLAIGAYFRQPSWPPVAFYADTIVLEFYFGMLIAWACQKHRRIPPVPGIALLFGGLSMLLMIHDFGNSAPRALVWGVPAAMIVWGTASLERYLTKTPGVILYLAEASYVIYLVHPLVAPGPVLVMAKLHIYRPAAAVVSAFLFALLVGAALHYFVDRPVTKWFRDHLQVPKQKVIHVH